MKHPLLRRLIRLCTKHRLTTLLPVASLAILLVTIWRRDGYPASRHGQPSASASAGHVPAVPAPKAVAGAVSRSFGAALWKFSEAPEGDAPGLTPARAAQSRGGNVLPSGRRSKVTRSSASAVLYLDFDGQPTTTYPDWPCGNPATPKSCVGSAGLALLQSFRSNEVSGLSVASDGSRWSPVSAFGCAPTMTDDVLSLLASNISHGFGHTLALSHDGASGLSDGYYDGHGSELRLRCRATL